MNRAARHEGVKALQLKVPNLASLHSHHTSLFPYFAASNYDYKMLMVWTRKEGNG